MLSQQQRVFLLLQYRQGLYTTYPAIVTALQNELAGVLSLIKTSTITEADLQFIIGAQASGYTDPNLTIVLTSVFSGLASSSGATPTS
jgi:hypothetical protein